MSDRIPELNFNISVGNLDDDRKQEQDMTLIFLSPRKEYIPHHDELELSKRSICKSPKDKKFSRGLKLLNIVSPRKKKNKECDQPYSVVDDSMTYMGFKYSSKNSICTLSEEHIKWFHSETDKIKTKKIDFREIDDKFSITLESNHIFFLAPFSKLFDIYRILEHLDFCKMYGIETQIRYINPEGDVLLVMPILDREKSFTDKLGKKISSRRGRHKKNASLAHLMFKEENGTKILEGSTYTFTEDELKQKYSQFIKINNLEKMEEISLNDDNDDNNNEEEVVKVPLRTKVVDGIWYVGGLMKGKFNNKEKHESNITHGIDDNTKSYDDEVSF